MKNQQIAVIFIIIILPIALVVGFSIGKQIDTLKLQTDYTTSLTNATYDAVRAFQINTVNNRYSSISSSKIRDIEASINTFFISLADNEPLTKEQLKMYVPGLVYTLYDGYYIYSKYNNVYPKNDGKILSEKELKENDANFGLKPYIYYSCRYRKGTKDFVVNYTLDNAITVYGNLGDGYETKSGYLIATDLFEKVSFNKDEPLSWQLTYDGVDVKPEELTEHLLFADETEGYYNYVVYNGQKVYYDPDATMPSEKTKYFYYQDYAKAYIPNYETNGEIINYLEKRVNNKKLYSTSSFEYYYNAKQFSEYIINKIGDIKQSDAVELDKYNNFTNIEFSLNTGDEKIFNVSKNNNPLLDNSTFDINRKAVIRKSIETNLIAAIANYNMYSSNNYEFRLPVLNEIEWDKITNNVSIISFLQGIPIGYKYYNNYCVITNNDNEEVVKKENIFIITEDEGIREYHLPGCEHLLEMKNSETIEEDITIEPETGGVIEIIGDGTVKTGETKTLTVKLNSDKPIGVITATIKLEKNLLKDIKIEAIGEWRLLNEYNPTKGLFKIMKEDGTTKGEVLKIEYTAGDILGEETVTLSGLSLTKINAEKSDKYDKVTKNITITDHDEAAKKYNIVPAYGNISFLRQTVRISEGDYRYFYPLTREEKPFLTTCYYCMVNATSIFNVEDIIKGEIVTKDNGKERKINSENNSNFKKIRETYIRALGRERNHLYQVNMDTFN